MNRTETVKRTSSIPAGGTGLRYLFEGSTNLVNWNWLGVRSYATGNIQFTDSSATNYPKRFYRASVP